jgi:hypothetical protein
MLSFIAAGLWNLSGPPPWWDEGWTLSVARTWVERGHYGRLLDGQFAPNGLEASFWVTAPVALAMRMFGVGLWQGRLFGVLCAAAAVALTYLLAKGLYTRRIALGTLVVLLAMSMHPQLHPLVMGRQVLAEMPMFVYLLAGYLGLLLALRRSPLWLALTIGSWGVAVLSKAQVLPFWAVSLAAPLLVAGLRRRWNTAALLGLALVGARFASLGMNWLPGAILAGHTLPVQPVVGLYDVVAWVPALFNRTYALTFALVFGLPTALGLIYAAWRWLRGGWAAADDGAYTVRLALLALAGSWFAWYLLLSVGVPRYLFPVTFVGSVFVAVLLNDLTAGFDLAGTLDRAGALVRGRGFNRQGAGALLALLLVATAVPLTGLGLYRYYLGGDDRSAEQVASFFNTRTPPGTRIETYESELHFLLDRPYHYPPDQLHVELNRRSLLGQDAPIDYDPLAADPDYLVVGRFARENGLYDAAIGSGAFRLLRRDGLYDIYQRVR